uniref:Galaxin-like repeats domain-containing protein n=1 Tax=Lotharella oceanica TaxID=641309 RepID=A0A7S2TNW9_9EUKA|mmetsp:Transcript_22784/g.42812  ORF Transcript_22784/g.42812 Transcript_22784/m.42812 type:complete len:188 (+) Transcript_22784:63-626(+)
MFPTVLLILLHPSLPTIHAQCIDDPYTGQYCCEGVQRHGPPSTPTQPMVCCGSELINLNQNICCDDAVNPIQGDPVSTACCAKQSINLNTNICCDGVVNEIQGDPLSTACCATKSYYVKMDICCGDVINKRVDPVYTGCCGSQAYWTTKDCCCHGKVTSPSDCPDSHTQCPPTARTSFNSTKNVTTH